jgi:hypothetical protein
VADDMAPWGYVHGAEEEILIATVGKWLLVTRVCLASDPWTPRALCKALEQCRGMTLFVRLGLSGLWLDAASVCVEPE